MCYKVVSEVKMTKESLLETAEPYMDIRIHVDGFWTDTVHASLHKYGEKWTVEQSHSSGGQEKGYRPDQEINMATAMIDLATFLKTTLTTEFKRELSDAVEAKRAKEKARREAEALAYQKELDETDPAIGEEVARNLVSAVRANAAIEGSYWLFAAGRTLKEGKENYGEWYRATLSNGRVYFRWYGMKPGDRFKDTEAVSAEALVNILTNSSKLYTRIMSSPEEKVVA